MNSLAYTQFHTYKKSEAGCRSGNRRQSAAKGLRTSKASRMRPVTAGQASSPLKWAAVTLFFFILLTGFMIVQSSASDIAPSPAVMNEYAVVVSSGESLWDIARSVQPTGADTRKTVYLIKERNGLNSSAIHPGQTLVIPSSVQ